MGNKNNAMKSIRKVLGKIEVYGMFGIAIMQNEKFDFVDDTSIRTMNAASIIQEVVANKNYVLLQDGLHIEVRTKDKKGYKVMEFDLENEDQLSLFPNAIDKTEYAVEQGHILTSISRVPLFDGIYRYETNEVTGMPEDIFEVKDDSAFSFQVGVKETLELANLLSGGRFAEVNPQRANGNEEKWDKDSVMQFIDFEAKEEISGTAGDVLRMILERTGLEQNVIQEILYEAGFPEVKQIDEDTDLEARGNTHIVVLGKEAEQCLKKDITGKVTITDPEKLMKCEVGDVEILSYIEEELKELDQYSDGNFIGMKGFENETESKKMLEVIRNKKNLTTEDLAELYDTIISLKKGGSTKALRQVNKRITKDYKEYAYKTGKKVNGMEEYMKAMMDDAEKIYEEYDEAFSQADNADQWYDKLNEQAIKAAQKGISIGKDEERLFREVTEEKAKLNDRLDAIGKEMDEHDEKLDELRFAQIYHQIEKSAKRQRKAMKNAKKEAESETAQSNEDIFNGITQGDMLEDIMNMQDLFVSKPGDELVDSEELDKVSFDSLPSDVDNLVQDSSQDSSQDQGMDF